MKITELPLAILAHYATKRVAIVSARPLDQDGSRFAVKRDDGFTDIWAYRDMRWQKELTR